MRHRKKTNHLSRKSAHRKAMLANMASSLILHKRITTTTAKAKELRTFVEPIITRSKEDSTHSRRMVFKNLRDKYAVSELFREVATKVGERPGGYTRIIKLGNRQGDNADTCIIELVDYNENLLAEKAAATKPKSTRRRRGGKKKEPGDETVAPVTAEVSETEAALEETAGEAETPAEPEEVEQAVESAPEAEAPAKPEAKTEAVTHEVDQNEAAAEVEEGVAEDTGETKPEEDADKEEKKEE
jgi:large subunit ribosomal protein L17